MEYVKGYSKLSPKAKEIFKKVHNRHLSNVGEGSRHEWTPIAVEEHKKYLKVFFTNGEWLHYMPNGTWY